MRYLICFCSCLLLCLCVIPASAADMVPCGLPGSPPDKVYTTVAGASVPNINYPGTVVAGSAGWDINLPGTVVEGVTGPHIALPGTVTAGGAGRVITMPDTVLEGVTGPHIALPDTVVADITGLHGFFVLAEDSLKRLAVSIASPEEDSVRLANNALFENYLIEVLSQEGSLQYPFDSLKTVSMLTPPDSAFRIVTWYVPLSGRQFRYFGLAQAAGPSHEKKEIYRLVEKDADEGQATEAEFTHDAWYAALYYELVMNTHHDEHHYVLLGWRADNPLTRKRIIEPFSWREGKPVFGAPVFDMDGQQPSRVIFEYSSRVNMGLLYDWQYMGDGSRERVPMIVFDRLEPLGEAYRGQRQHYVPEGNVFDAFIFVEGRWQLRRDVDARRHPETD